MRKLTAYIIAPIMRAAGFRFSKSYRHGETMYHRAVYRIVDTVRANINAGL